MIIAVDFDGTCVTHEFPRVGAAEVLKELTDKGHKIPLKHSYISDRPYVDWDIIRYYLHAKGIL